MTEGSTTRHYVNRSWRPFVEGWGIKCPGCLRSYMDPGGDDTDWTCRSCCFPVRRFHAALADLPAPPGGAIDQTPAERTP